MRLHLVSIVLLSGCAAPLGAKAVNPACVWHCSVALADAENARELATLTVTQGQTSTGGTRSRTTTETGF